VRHLILRRLLVLCVYSVLSMPSAGECCCVHVMDVELISYSTFTGMYIIESSGMQWDYFCAEGAEFFLP